jgi:hypothetical protein
MIFILFKFHLCFKKTGRVGMGGDDIHGPKQRQTRRLGS